MSRDGFPSTSVNLEFKNKFPYNSRRAALALFSDIKYAGYIERYNRTIKRILDYKDYVIADKELLLLSKIISNEAKEVLKTSDIVKVGDMFGLVDSSDIESLVLVLKKQKN